MAKTYPPKREQVANIDKNVNIENVFAVVLTILDQLQKAKIIFGSQIVN